MYRVASACLLAALVATPWFADPSVPAAGPAGARSQEPAPGATGVGAPEFAAALDAARAAFAHDERSKAVAALRQAILVVQQRQRQAVLAALPLPAGFAHEDVAPASAAKDPFAAEIAALGLDVERRYRGEGDVRFDIEVSTDSPLVEVFARLLDEPAKVTGSGGTIESFGAHRALAKWKEGHGELTVVLRDRHVVKVTTDGLTQAALTAIVDREVVERIDRELAL